MKHRLQTIAEVKLLFWGSLLNGAWEFLHSALYTDHANGLWYVIWTRIHCTVGDVMILLFCFWITSLLFRTRTWFSEAHLFATTSFFVFGLGYTVYSEWYNTTVSKTWQYADTMPVVFGIGISPILQWIVIPPLVVALSRRARSGHHPQTETP